MTTRPIAHVVLLLPFVASMARAAPQADASAPLDLRSATIVIPPDAGEGERVAADVLREETAIRTGLSWSVARSWPDAGPVVAIALASRRPVGIGQPGATPPADRPEGYRLVSRQEHGWPVVWIVGADRRGLLYGVGGLLRALDYGRRAASLPANLDIATSPRYPLRGHQLGYRPHSNTYDAWTAARYDRYIRELALFGANAVENIPFQDTKPGPLMPIPRPAMARQISEICARYDIDYWLWLPADFKLSDGRRRAAALDALDALVASLPRLDAIFVPGGDPGDNDASLVVPYLGAIVGRVRHYHPRARVWLSLQQFDAREIDVVFAWIDRERPEWLGGLVGGPSSLPLSAMRARLDRRYQLRDYPDISHTVRCQHPVPAWDPAFNFTLGREPINPRPVFYARLHDRVAPDTDGFITYSDGVTDDVNKIVLTRKAWDPAEDPRAILTAYARVFFGPAVADRAASGLLALERNWEGPLAANNHVAETLALWQQLERDAPDLQSNWRWQMALLRAYYDAYTRQRLRLEVRLEDDANASLGEAPRIGSDAAMQRAASALAGPPSGCCPEWRRRIETLCGALFESIGLQTSVARYGASGYERGAVLDFLDHPLNNRWWLEDEFARVRALRSEAARLARLESIRTWSNPGPGSFYDDVGHVGASPHVRWTQAADGGGDPIPHFTWKGGPTRTRLSWLTSLRWPASIVYEDLDAKARYEVRLHVVTDVAAGQIRLRIDGVPVLPVNRAVAIGDRLRFVVPAEASRDGRLVLTFDPVDEEHLNWRRQSRLVEAWLLAEPRAPAGSPTGDAR